MSAEPGEGFAASERGSSATLKRGGESSCRSVHPQPTSASRPPMERSIDRLRDGRVLSYGTRRYCLDVMDCPVFLVSYSCARPQTQLCTSLYSLIVLSGREPALNRSDHDKEAVDFLGLNHPSTPPNTHKHTRSPSLGNLLGLNPSCHRHSREKLAPEVISSCFLSFLD